MRTVRRGAARRPFPSARLSAICGSLVALCLVVIAPEIRAERDEATIGARAGVVFPNFAATSATAFTLATWTAGVEAQYGITDDVSLWSALIFSSFSGKAPGYSVVQNSRSYTGTLNFTGTFYRPSVGARYKLYGGYNLAPYLEAQLGYLWAVYQRTGLHDQAGHALGVGPDTFAEGQLTSGIGLGADLRLFNMMQVGLAARYVRALGDGLYSHHVEAPLLVSFYW